MSGYDMAESLAAWAWRASWQGAALACAVGLIVWLAGRRLSPGWRFGLWGLVLVRLAMPAVVEVRWDWGKQKPAAAGGARELTEGEFATALREAANEAPVTAKGPGAFSVEGDVGAATPKAPDPFSWTTRAARRAKPIAIITWLAGIAFFAIRILLASLRLSQAVRRTPRVTDPRVLRLVQSCCTEMSIRRPPEARQLPAGASPALVGFLRPKILLPLHVLDAMADHELRLILLHELAHVRRRDVLINWLATLVAIVHWANPAVWVVLWRMRTERELACDELVLKVGRDDHAGQTYARTILKLVEALSTSSNNGGGWSGRAPAAVATAAAAIPGGGAVGILEGKAQLQRRLQMIARFDSTTRRWPAVAAVSLGLLVGGLALSGAATRAADNPNKNQPPAGAGNPTPAAEQAKPPQPRGVTSAAAPAAPAAGEGVARPATFKDWTRTSSPEDQAANARTAQKLKKTVDKVDFQGVALADVLDFIRDSAGVDVMVEWRALEEAGITRDLPVTLRLHEPAPLDAVLTLLFRSTSLPLRYEIDRGVIVVTTADRQAPQVTRVYDVTDLLADSPAPALGGGGGAAPVRGLGGPDAGVAPGLAAMTPPGDVSQLISLITATIHPQEWMNAGGTTASIATFKNKLVVKAPEPIQKEVFELLEMLREHPSTTGRTTTPTSEKQH